MLGRAIPAALANLIDNAIKFTPSGGTIQLQAETGSTGIHKLDNIDVIRKNIHGNYLCCG